jgi:hypothetical protein
MPQPEIHPGFAAALLDPARPTPTQIARQDGASPQARFAVYRNNVMVGLVDALAARFPVTLRLVGEEFFRAMAREYAGRNPPRDPVLWHYGASLPEFIAGFDPAASLPWLADVARVEIAWSEAWAAPEGAALTAAALQGFDPERLLTHGAALHPATRLLRSAHPVGSLWSAHQREGEPQPPEAWLPEDLLITRPLAEVQLCRLPEGAHACLAALASGKPLEAAFEAALDQSPDADPGALLILFLEAGALTSLEDPTELR